MYRDGITDITAPITMNTFNFPAMTGTPLKVTIGGQGSGGNDQFLLLTTTGIFAWGTEGKVLDNALTNSAAFAKIVAPTGSDTATRLPAGVSPSSVVMFFATYQTLAILTDSGYVYILTQAGTAIQGDSTFKATTSWHKVKRSASSFLDKVIAIRGNVFDSTKNSFLALTSEGKVFAWGASVYPGGGGAKVTAKLARQLVLPAEFGAANVPKMIAVTGGAKDNAATNPTYYVVSYFGGLYAMGDNRQKQCGDFTTTERLTWVKSRFSSAVADTFKNVSSISVQEHTAAFPAIAVVTDTGNLYCWGDNSSNMLGSVTTGDLDPQVPGGFTPGTDKAIFAEVGGHTLVYVKQGSTQFCYVGHAISGSAGNTDNTTYSSFNCSTTPVVSICGSVPVVPSTATSTIAASPTSIIGNGVTTSTITVQLKTAAGANLTTSGGIVGMSTTAGTISSVTDNNDGTYTAVLTSSASVATAIISFTVNGYAATNTATVNFTTMLCAPAITGTAVVCVGESTTLSNTTAGGTWTSATPAVATIGTSGVVTGVSSGTTAVTYSLAGGCIATVTVTVSAAPSVITGTLSACAGGSSTLSNATGGGTWISGTTSVATIGSSGGVVSAVSAGTSVITYTAPGGCSTSSIFTVNPSPTSVTATASPNGVCNGANLTLTGTATGASTYSWSGPGGTAVGSPTSLTTSVTGVVSGNAGVYTLTAVSAVGSCSTTATTAAVTVNALPSISVGTSTVICTGSSTTLTASGGSTYSWSPSTGLSATTGSSVSASPTVTTTYTVTGTNTLSCSNTATVTVTVVNTTPTSVMATASSTSLCSGNNLTLTGSATTSAGTLTYAWAGPNSYTASVQNPASFGVSTLSAGVYTITATNVCGSTTGVTTAVTVNAVPTVAAISGSSTICTGTSTTYTSTTSGGAWSSSNTAIGSINSSTGELTGISGGAFSVSYAVTNSCGATTVTKPVSGYFTPTMGVSVGSASTCVGSTTTYTATPTTGYTWSSTNTAVATINSGGSAVGIASGTTTISYVHNTAGCYTTAVLTVNSLPTVSVTTSVCEGATQTATASPTGGAWASSNTAVGTIGSATGVFAALSGGSTNISYTLSGCTVLTAVSVTGLPAAITGTTSVCEGSTTQLSSGTASETWSSSNTAVATITTVNTTTAVVSGVSTGTTLISYTNSGGCRRVTTVTVTSPFTANTGDALVCMGQTITLSNATSGGSWVSSDPAKATINSSTGLVSAVATGTTNITYSTTSPSSCQATTQVTVHAAIPANNGTATVCVGSTTTLSNTTTGGTWSSSNGNVTVGSGTGVVTGVTAGTSILTYSLSSGCYKTTTVTVNPLPAAIAGAAILCEGESTTLTNSTSGGTWISGNTAVGTIGSTSGVVAALSAGTTIVSYRLTTTGCQSTKEVTVNGLPSVIGGTSLTCVGITTTLSATPSGGTWSSSDVAVATIGSSNGSLTGVAAGTSNITYTLATGCKRATVATVNSSPAAIAGTFVLCEGSSTTLTNITTGGTWISSDTAIATIGSATGIVDAVSGGTTTITYKISATGCYSTQTFTTNPLPAAITGSLSVCEGSTTVLSTTPTGGTWSSSNTAIAAVGTNGVVSGVAAGTANISYSLSSGCVRSVTVTVNSAPTVAGTLSMCVGTSSTLSSSPTGGTWQSSSVAVATVGSLTGIVSGVSGGNSTISYTDLNGCRRTVQVTVNSALATDITGPTGVCVGYTITMSNATPGGAWTSSDPARATIDPTTGVVTGITNGSVVITYSVSAGCNKTKTISIHNLPLPITGTATVCEQNVTVLSTITGSSGTWSSSDPSVASVTPTIGNVTGVVSGTATITYTASSGCFVVRDVTVMPTPTAITGASTVCVGSQITLSSATTGGTWSSNTTSAATVGSGSGVVTAVGAGNTVISYILSNGCRAIKPVTVNNIPAAITGNTLLCLAGTSTLTSTTTGGTWASGNTSVATIGSAGALTPVAAGTTTISYTLSTVCMRTAEVTINAAPATSTGPGTVCVGSTAAFSNAATGGTWSSSNTAKATIVFNTGVLTGVAAGTTNITYTVAGPGCYTVSQVTIDATPAAITGTLNACVGSTSTLSHTISGGTWSSGNTSIATVDASTGVVTAVASGYATITYQATSSCFVTASFNSKALPPAITGTPYACVGTTTVLSNTVSGGTWSSSNTATAIIHATSGTLTGMSTGTSAITYKLATGCYRITEVSVNAAPAAITGVNAACPGSTAVLSCTPAGGAWTSSNTAIATVDASSGTVTAVAPGTTSITYTQSITGCRSFRTFTVGVAPAAITGTLTMCEGSTTVLANATTGGTWSSSNLAIATVGSTSGITTGVAAGTATISYNHGGGCAATAVVTVSPAVGAISGDAGLCVGGQTTLANAITGGTWSSGATAIATVGSATGIVSGVSAGTAVISYRISDYCYSTQVVTVGATPAAITGASGVCIGSDITLSHAVAGGTWSSSNPAVGSVDAATGIVTGIAFGATTITYEVSNGCFTTKPISINNLPLPITGTTTVCEQNVTVLSTITGSSGTWSSSDSSVASVTPTIGNVTGVSSGTATITYTAASTGCYVVTEVTVMPTPAIITGDSTVCVGSQISLSSASSGGTWSSNTLTAAVVDSTTGVVTAVGAGNTIISYILPNGCRVIKPVTVNILPGVITGTTKYCVGGTATLGSTTAGGTWSSDAVAATVTAGGVVAGIMPGTSLIIYTLATGCARTAVVTVNAALAANSGSNSICVGSTTTLANSTSGGTWSSSDATKATVNATSGLVTGIATGTSNINYIVAGAGCVSTTQVTVNSTVPAITGTLNVCVGAQTTLGNTVTGGTWSSSNTAKATIDSATGVVTGIAAGTINITYSLSSACYMTATFTVKAQPVISATSAVCAASSATLTGSPTGGAWSSSDVSKLTIGSTSGVVTGVAAGTSTVSYFAAGCYATRTTTVNQLPDLISGSAVVCVGATTTLTGTPSGGTWVSSTVARATVGSLSGVVTGVAAGTSVISYTLPTGCRRTTVVTVGAAPSAISGTTNVCLGSTTNLSSTTAGGTWSSANTAIATTGTATAASTLVTGMSVGATTISYTVFGCSRVTTVNVTDPIAPITGDTAMCVGSAAPFTTATTGGTWTSSNVTIARVGSISGIASAAAVGSVTITYRTGATCFKTKQVTVGTGLATITGSTNACVGYTTTLGHPVSGGVWSSSNTARATVNASTGAVTGVSNGSVVITYALSTGCYVTKSVVVYNLPLPITGTTTVCEENVTVLSTVTGSSGTWSTSNPSIATVVSTIGNVTGVASGTATITYTAYSGCYVVKDVTVIPTPAAITGTSTVCVGSQITLASATSGGTWSSNTPTAAVVGATSGVVTAVGGGNAIISYVMPNGCRRTTTITTNVQPAAITGPAIVCVDNSSTLSSATLGQTWSSSNTSVATVGSLSTSTASVTPVAAGTATISYTNAFGCSRTYNITVNGAVPAITGVTSVCTGKTVTLSNALSGGTWSSSSAAKASIGSASGLVTGVASGSAVITYRVSPACFKTSVMSVNVSPAGITGLSSVLAGASTTLACTTTGGEWSSSNTAIGTVNSTSGSVTGVSAGTMTISYVIPASGCVSVKAMTVNPAPLAKDVAETDVVAEVGEFAVFPNPSQGAFNIQTSVSGMLSVFSVDGKLITEYQIVAGQNTIVLPATLASGTYMGRFTAADGDVKVFRLMYQP